MQIGNAGKNQMVGMKMAKQRSKGSPMDGNFKDVSPVKQNPNSPYANPSKVSKITSGTPAVSL